MNKVTNEQIDNLIDTVEYYRWPSTTMIICMIKMASGFNVTGEGSCINEADFDPDIGKDLAFKAAREKIWRLEGYRVMSEGYRAMGESVGIEAPADNNNNNNK